MTGNKDADQPAWKGPRVTLAKVLTWLAWKDPSGRFPLPKISQEDTSSVEALRQAWERYESKKEEIAPELVEAWRCLLPEFPKLSPRGCDCTETKPPLPQYSKTIAIPADDLEDYESARLADYLLFVSEGPYVLFPAPRQPDGSAGVRIYGNITLDRAAFCAAFGDRSDAERAAASPRNPMRKRKGRHDWTPAFKAVFSDLCDNGVPESGDGGQARLEKLVTSTFPPHKCPSESSIREQVSKWIEERRKDLNEGR